MQIVDTLCVGWKILEEKITEISEEIKKAFRGKRTCSNFYCRSYKTQSDVCSPHKIRTVDLYSTVLDMIILQIKMVLSLEKTIEKVKNNSASSNYEQEYLSKVNKLNNEIDKLKKLKKVSYEDWKFEKISREEFLNYSKDYDERIEIYNKEIKALENVYLENVKNLKKDDYWIEHFRRNKKVKELTKDIIDELIECIYVHEGGNISIKFKYQDEYEKAMEFIREMEEAKNGKMESCCLCEAF